MSFLDILTSNLARDKNGPVRCLHEQNPQNTQGQFMKKKFYLIFSNQDVFTKQGNNVEEE